MSPFRPGGVPADETVPLGPDPALMKFGAWSASAWNATTDETRWEKVLVWRHEGLVSATLGVPLPPTTYLERCQLSHEDAGSLELRTAAEAQGWRELNRKVREAAKGGVYWPATHSAQMIVDAMVAVVKAWAVNPEDAERQLREAAERAQSRYRVGLERLAKLGGDPDSPRNTGSEWWIPVVPWKP